MRSFEELRRELSDLRARVKPHNNKTQDYLEQRQIENRIRLLQSHLETIERGGPRP